MTKAIREGSVDIVQTALERGYKVNTRYGYSRTTLLMTAVMEGQAEIVRFLAAHADVNATQRNGATALMLAADQVRGRGGGG